MFDPVSYLMGKKSGGGGGSSVANALFVTMTYSADYSTATTAFTAGQIAEAVDNDMNVVLYGEGDEGMTCVVSRTGFTFDVSSAPNSAPSTTITASSADSNTFTMAW